MDRSYWMLWAAWTSVGLNVVQLIALLYFMWRIRKIKAPDLLGMDRALHQRVDSLEALWQVKWESLSARIATVAAKLKNFFTA